MNKALIIQTRPGVGDLCMFLPYIQQIHENDPKLEITLITKKKKDFRKTSTKVRKIN